MQFESKANLAALADAQSQPTTMLLTVNSLARTQARPLKRYPAKRDLCSIWSLGVTHWFTGSAGRPLTSQIKLDDGRIYFAPSSEFVLLS